MLGELQANSFNWRQRYKCLCCLHIAAHQLVMLRQLSHNRLMLSLSAFISYSTNTKMFVVICCSASVVGSEKGVYQMLSISCHTLPPSTRLLVTDIERVLLIKLNTQPKRQQHLSMFYLSLCLCLFSACLKQWRLLGRIFGLYIPWMLTLH